jgi:hypothetical protein
MMKLKSIEFHYANGMVYNFPNQGYTIPADEDATVVTFYLTEGQDATREVAEVIYGRFVDYNSIVKIAQDQLLSRLIHTGKIAEKIRQQVEILGQQQKE